MNEDALKESLNEKQRYFKLRSGITQEVYNKVGEGFDKELQILVNKIHSDELDVNSKELVDFDRNKLEKWYPEVLREAILVMFCSLMEEVLRDIAKICVPNYDDEIKRENGSWLKKHLGVLNKAKGVDVSEDDVEFLQYFIDLRNCVVHAGGNVNKSRYGDGIKEAVSSLQEYGRSHGSYMLGEWEDGYLKLDDHFVPVLVKKGEKIINGVFKNLQE